MKHSNTYLNCPRINQLQFIAFLLQHILDVYLLSDGNCNSLFGLPTELCFEPTQTMDDVISNVWCCGLTWRCTPFEAIGIWSVILFYSSILIVTCVHFMILRNDAITTSSSRQRATRESDDDDFGLLIWLVIYFFTFTLGCLLWAVNPLWVHPIQIWQIQILGSAVLVLCFCLFIKVHIDMGDTWYPIPNAPPELVTHGIFRYARHPMYAIFIWAAISTLLATLNWVIAWCVVGTVMVTLRRIKTEELLLIELFGERYVEYQRLF